MPRVVMVSYDNQIHVAKMSRLPVKHMASIEYEPRSDKRDLLAIKVKKKIFTEKERPTSCCEQLQNILREYLYK